MKRFNQGNFSDRNSSRGRSDNSGMYDAICDACGKPCKVPFKPTGSKPVYCSSCFEKQEGGNSRRRDNRNSRGVEMFSAICDDCGKECKVPFKPSSDKPIYCSSCFEKRGNGRPAGGSSINLNEVNEKLDRIIKILEDQEF